MIPTLESPRELLQIFNSSILEFNINKKILLLASFNMFCDMFTSNFPNIVIT